MRIGIFSDTYIPNINGVATSIEMLKKGLEKLGHKVYIVTVNAEKYRYKKEDNVLRIPGVPIGIFDYRLTSIYPIKAIKTIKDWNLDIIHSQTEFGIGTFARFISKQLNIPLVHTYHTMYEDYTHYITKGYFKKTSQKIVEYLTLFYCDSTATELIVPTKKTADLFVKKYKVKRKVNIIPTGIEIEKFHKKYKLDDLRKKLNIENEKILLFVGRLGKEKSVDVLIKNQKDLDSKLLIVGDGPERKNLENLVKELKLESKVIFTGKVPLKDVAKYYKLADVFVSASTTETQGLTIIEALASSLPVLAINDESFSNVIKNGYNGFLFNNNDEYIKYANMLLKKSIYKINAYESSLKYSNEVFAGSVLEVYENAIKNGRKPLLKGREK